MSSGGNAPERAGRDDLVPLVAAWLARRGAEQVKAEVIEVERMAAGRPGLLDVVARVDGRLAHLVVGLHARGTELRALAGAEDAVLGEVVDEAGPAIAVDALFDADLAPLVFEAIVGGPVGVVSIVGDDDRAVVLDVDDRCSFSVFPWLTEGPHPGVEMLVSLDEVGFNHLAAPLALWRRRGRDLGIVQDLLPEAADGWALARTSLRDLYGARIDPEAAGGDFADEARALGTMAARLHLASARAFGRRIGRAADAADEIEAVIEGSSADTAAPRLAETLAALRASSIRAPLVRTHGDLHLGRTARTNQGWVVADWRPGGADPAGEIRHRSPLADVADLLWSLRHVARAALAERDQALAPGLERAAEAWTLRNQRACLDGYFSTPGIQALVPEDRQVTELLLGAFELEEAAARGGQRPAA